MAAAEKAKAKAQGDLKTEKTAHDKTKAELENLRKQVKDLKSGAKVIIISFSSFYSMLLIFVCAFSQGAVAIKGAKAGAVSFTHMR